MNRDPFLRLALIAACSAYSLALLVIVVRLGVWPAVLTLVGGCLGALSLTIVLEPKPPSDEPVEDLRQRRRQPAEGTRGFERIE